MSISPTYFRSTLIVLVLKFLTSIDCSQKSENISSTVQPYNTSRELYDSETSFSDLLWQNHQSCTATLSLISLVPNIVMAEQQETFHAGIIKDENILFQKLSLQNLDFNNTYNNCSVNSTCTPTYLRAPTFQQSALTRVIVLLLIALFSLVGNIATLSSILKTGRHSSSTLYMLLFHLALADLLVSIFCILADALWTLSVQWYGGNLLCKGVKFMQMFSLYVSTFVLVLIGFDRLSAVRFPMSRVRAKHRVRMGLVCVWTLSALFSLPQVFIFSVMRGPFTEDFYQCVTYAFYTAQWQEQLYTTLSLLLMFLLPLVILLSTYIATFKTIASQESLFSERISHSAIDDARQKVLRRAKIRSLLITVVIVCAFLICWTPYYVTMLIFMFLDPSEQMSRDLQEAIFFFGSSTAAINPLIYGAFHLRHPRPRSRSTSTFANNSSSTTRVDNYSRKSQAKRCRGESLSLHFINSELPSDAANLYRHSSVPLCEPNNRIILH